MSLNGEFDGSFDFSPHFLRFFLEDLHSALFVKRIDMVASATASRYGPVFSATCDLDKSPQLGKQ